TIISRMCCFAICASWRSLAPGSAMFIDRLCSIPLAPSGAASGHAHMSLLTELGLMIYRRAINIALQRSGRICVDANETSSWRLQDSVQMVVDSMLGLILTLDVIQYPFQQISRFRFASVFARFLARLFSRFFARPFVQLFAEAFQHSILRAFFQNRRVQSEGGLFDRAAHFDRNDHCILLDKKIAELRRNLTDALKQRPDLGSARLR